MFFKSISFLLQARDWHVRYFLVFVFSFGEMDNSLGKIFAQQNKFPFWFKDRAESLGKIMIFMFLLNHSRLFQATGWLIECKHYKFCLSSPHRAYKTIEEDDLKFPLIYGEGKKVGTFAFLTPKEEGILCCLPLSLACGSAVFSTQYLFILSFWQLERISWFCHKSVLCLGGGRESSTY